ncbi:hypothetical protein MNV_1310015 [Candidatus Methanoperedens nitroreducens]|uniref:Uncharacterized protein n=1 Tax=Candidatus Methanoperedens nitratireducens TaxID=1392998 RepID=A0A284VKH3_9EURY|nr:hypothetical protein MNV_1310015 [Candidatus Methanoperedens nitroreducens]
MNRQGKYVEGSTAFLHMLVDRHSIYIQIMKNEKEIPIDLRGGNNYDYCN